MTQIIKGLAVGAIIMGLACHQPVRGGDLSAGAAQSHEDPAPASHIQKGPADG